MGKRTRYSPEFKAKAALDAIRGEQTLSELSCKHGVHPNLISQWKRQATGQMSSLFGGGGAEEVKEEEADVTTLHAKIGQLTLENDLFGEGFAMDSRHRSEAHGGRKWTSASMP